MTGWKTWALFAGLLGIALSLGIAAGGAANESAALSVENPAPGGAMVLFTWLRENGVVVSMKTDDFLVIDPAVRTVVVTAPRVQVISQAEVDALERFVTAGGTLVYLVPRGAMSCPMNHWLGVTRGALPALDDGAALQDPAGATVQVTNQSGLTAGITSLRVAADRLIQVADARPVTAAAALWVKPLGQGEVWLAAGPDLAENARLELLGNSRLWLNVGARGPVAFDEFHHHSAAATPLTVNLIATALQLLLCAALFVVARGARLGPARPTLPSAHRSSLEYVRAMGALVGGAKVDSEVVEHLRDGLRRAALERLGLSPSLPSEQWVREVSKVAPAAELERVFAANDVLTVGQAAARVEAALVRGGGTRSSSA